MFRLDDGYFFASLVKLVLQLIFNFWKKKIKRHSFLRTRNLKMLKIVMYLTDRDFFLNGLLSLHVQL